MAKKADKKHGDNKPPVTADVRAECYAEYAELRGQSARISAKIAAMFGRFESQGIDDIEKKAIKNAYALASKDEATVARQHKANTQVLIAVGIITVADTRWTETVEQAEMELEPTGEAAENLAAARAYGDGYRAGRDGAPIDGGDPLGAGSRQFVGWRQGFDDGRADRLAIKPEADKVTQAQPRKRGRKAAAAADDIGAPAGNA